MKSHVRVAVIGGGVMGTSLIYHLSQLGWKDVVLIEKNDLTAGSTWHAAGLCTHYAHNITIMNMRAYSVKLYRQELERETGQAVSFHACGGLRVTRSRDRLDEFRQVQGIGKFAGFEFHILSPSELNALYPMAEVDDLVGAIYEPLDGHVDPSQATHAMAKGARNRGAEIYRRTQVIAIARRTDGDWEITTNQGTIVAEHVVNAAGTWCREIGDMMGVDLPVVPMLHQYIVTDRIDAFANLDHELPMIRDPDESWYLRMERDGVIIGPYEKNGKAWSIDGVAPEFGMDLLEPDLDAIAEIAEKAMIRVPAAANAGIKTIVNGPITFTPDANPLIGPAYNLPNAWILTGSSMGVMEGGGAGKMLAEWMECGEPPMDALAVDPRRFGDYADRRYRIAKAVECFAAQFGIHYPYEERTAGRRQKLTPSYEILKSNGAIFGSAYGFERPNWYSRDAATTESTLSFRRANWFRSVAEECMNLQNNVGLGDLSAFSKFSVHGPQATRFINQLGTNMAPQPGRLNLNYVLTASGGVHSEFSVTSISSSEYYLVSAAAALRQDLEILNQRAHGHEVGIENVTDTNGVFGLMGPNAEAFLAELADQDLSLSTFPNFSARPICVAGVPVLALRVSYLGVPGFELHHAIASQTELLRYLLQAGRKYELGFYGAFAMNSMRLEKAYPAWGLDLTTERTPMEAGLKSLLKTENRQFIGRNAMLERQRSDDFWSMKLVEISECEFDPFYSHCIISKDQAVGFLTSGNFGHRMQKAIGLGYFRSGLGETEAIQVEILGRRYGAKIINPWQ